jgi:drug/metabolite transporter (DMT)-like permease
MTAHAFLLLAVGSLGLLGVMHKVADHRRCRPEAINLFLFLGAGMATVLFLLWRMGPAQALVVPGAAVITGVICGLLSSIAILSFQRGIRFGKISTSWLVINLSTALPTVLSILIYGERVGLRRTVGLTLAIVALAILWQERRREEARASK